MTNSTGIKLPIYFPSIIIMIVALFLVASPPPAFSQGILSQQLRTNLYNASASAVLLDATISQYSDAGNNAVDRNDAVKIVSISAGTHLGMLRNNINLIIERRKSITVNDTIFYNLMTPSKRDYRFEFIAVRFDINVVSGFLEDAYLKTTSPVNLADTTSVNFTVNADAASAAPNRFRFIFRYRLILPFTLNVGAIEQNKDISVRWTTANEANIKLYNLEKSTDGLEFITAFTQTAHRSNSIENYQWLDLHVKKGMHYYRIRSINDNDEVLYSGIVKVEVKEKSEITVYPNPVVNGKINIKLMNQAKGNYVLKLVDNFGHPVITKQIYISDSNVTTETITVGQNFVKGTHHLEILGPGNTITSINVVLQ